MSSRISRSSALDSKTQRVEKSWFYPQRFDLNIGLTGGVQSHSISPSVEGSRQRAVGDIGDASDAPKHAFQILSRRICKCGGIAHGYHDVVCEIETGSDVTEAGIGADNESRRGDKYRADGNLHADQHAGNSKASSPGTARAHAEIFKRMNVPGQ